MNMKIMRKIAGILIISAIIGANLNAQTRNDVINVYNEGAKAMQTDVKAAIEAFEKVVVLSDQVGETAADLKQKAVQVLPGLYVKVASNYPERKKTVHRRQLKLQKKPQLQLKNMEVQQVKKMPRRYWYRVITIWVPNFLQRRIMKMPFWLLTAFW